MKTAENFPLRREVKTAGKLRPVVSEDTINFGKVRKFGNMPPGTDDPSYATVMG